jgi:hypothetical protein
VLSFHYPPVILTPDSIKKRSRECNIIRLDPTIFHNLSRPLSRSPKISHDPLPTTSLYSHYLQRRKSQAEALVQSVWQQGIDTSGEEQRQHSPWEQCFAESFAVHPPIVGERHTSNKTQSGLIHLRVKHDWTDTNFFFRYHISSG